MIQFSGLVETDFILVVQFVMYPNVLNELVNLNGLVCDWLLRLPQKIYFPYLRPFEIIHSFAAYKNQQTNL